MDAPALALLVATRGEERAVRRACARSGSGRAVRVRRIGVGPSAAARATEELLAEGAAGSVLLVGLAGGLVADLSLGDAVVATCHVAADEDALGDPLPVDAPWPRALGAALDRAGIAYRAGPFVTSPVVIGAPAAKRAWGERGPLAVEMEGLAVARACRRAGVPFASVRAVLDPLDMALPDLAPVAQARGHARALRLTQLVVERPGLTIGLPKLAWAAVRAHARLERAVRAVLDGLLPSGGLALQGDAQAPILHVAPPDERAPGENDR